MQKKVLAIVVTGLVVAGCAPATMQGMRAESKEKQVIEIDRGYQAVYRTVMENARRCWQDGTDVRGDLFTDIKTGEITVATRTGYNTSTWLGMDIEAISESKTRLTVFNSYGTWKPMANAVRAWFESGSKECRVAK